jgi:hypothetical protein
MTTNTLTNLIPALYASLDVVSRELVGLIPAVTLDARASAAAVGQSVYVPIAPDSNSLIDNTPAMSIPSEADQTIGSTAISITKSKSVPFSWSGEEELGLNSGAGAASIQNNQITQAMRTLVNSVETDLAALQSTFSRAAGTAATTPFATNTAGLTAARKILVDNGAPLSDASLVLDSTAGANLRTLLNVNSARVQDQTVGEQGIIQSISNLSIRESAQIVTSTAGAMASATTSSAALTVGQTALPLATAGTGVVAAGDVITLANDTNQYVVTSVSFAGANPASGDTITIAAPGIRKAQGAATRAITVVAAAARNMAFSRSAIVLAARMPTRPAQGDLAIDVMTITDPRSGLSFEVSVYAGFRKVVYHIALAWGVKNIKPEHTALLLG